MAVLASLMVAALALTGCAARNEGPVRNTGSYVVFFTATRSSDHAALSSASVPVTLGKEATLKISSQPPMENQPALPQFLVRLNRAKQPGAFEMVTRADVREAIRNKKGKLKVSKRFIGALVPTRLGETQVVSTDSDPIHLEARLERR